MMPAPRISSFYARRRRSNAIWMGLSAVAAAIGLTGLIVIFVVLFLARFFRSFGSRVHADDSAPWQVRRAPQRHCWQSDHDDKRRACRRPVGMLAGTYLAEYGRHSRLALVVRFINDILLSAPSIVIGLFVYEIVVVPMGHFSAIAGSIALGVLVVPVVVRTTEDMLNLVPNTLREAGAALGMPRSLMIQRIAYRAASAGLLTGVLLAVARVSGETAPLLFTALNNQFWSLDLT